MLSKASSRMYILRVCKSYGYSKDQLNNLFNSLIMSVFLCEVEAWGAACQWKFLDKIDRFLKRAHRFGFTTKKTAILDLIKNRDSELFKNVISGDHILPKRRCVLRECKHDFILPRVKTERFGWSSYVIWFVLHIRVEAWVAQVISYSGIDEGNSNTSFSVWIVGRNGRMGMVSLTNSFKFCSLNWK